MGGEQHRMTGSRTTECAWSAVAAREKREDGIHIVLGEITVAIQENDHFVQNPADAVQVSIITLQDDLVAAGNDPGFGKRCFDAFQIDIIEAEEEKGFGLFNFQSSFFQIGRRYLVFSG